MKPPVNLNKILTRKGLNPTRPYKATVIDDNDPAELGRIRARVPVWFDHVPDDKLPWSIPLINHPQGLKGGSSIGRTGKFHVAKKGTIVALYFPVTGNPNISRYDTSVPIDMDNRMNEFSVNYPSRIGQTFDNGFQFIVDTKTNEILLSNPGDMNVTMLGDVNLTVIGNMQTVVSSSKDSVPDYILNAPGSTVADTNPFPAKRIKFKGLLGGGDSGNYHVDVEKNVTFKVGKDVKWDVGGAFEHKIGKNYKGKAGSSWKAKASRIDWN